MKSGTKIAIRAVVFLAVAVLIFTVVQEILTPRDTWPYHKEKTSDMVAEISELTESDIQAFFLGTSHTMFSVDPMRIYKEAGIVTYDLSSSAQRIDASYFVLKRAFQKQSPKYVFFDAGGLFNTDTEDDFLTTSANASYRYLLDSPGFNGDNKIEFAKTYSEHFVESKRTSAFMGALLPIYQYHSRWKELEKNDFTLFPPARNYFLKGYYMTSVTKAASVDQDWMNEVAEIDSAADGWIAKIEYNEARDLSVKTAAYKPEIREKELFWLLRIKELCEENGAELRLIKIPCCEMPQSYDGAWTEIKSELTKKAAADNGIPFVDLQYDFDLGIDWSADTQDGGKHMNYRGAKKVTDFFADYLQTECGLEGQYDENYEADIPAYDTLCKVAELQMTAELSSYLALADSFDDVTVFLSASDDMMRCLSEENRRDLSDFGLRTDFNALQYSDSFLAVKEGDTVVYEASSNRRITSRGTLENGSAYTVTSAGWRVGSVSKIIIDGAEYSMNTRGLNIVVLDNRSKLVLDSVAFDTWNDGDQSAKRDLIFDYRYSPLGSFDGEAYLLNYEKYLAEQTAGNREYRPVKDGVYNIVFAGNNGCVVDVPFGVTDEDANIWLCDRNGEVPQEFEFHFLGDGLYTIRAVCSDKVLAIENMGSTPGSNVVQQSYTGLDSQKWFVAQGEDGAFNFISPYNNCALDVENGVSEQGTNIQVWTRNHQTAQQFFLEPVG